MDKMQYALLTIDNGIVCKENDKCKIYHYEKYVTTKNNQSFKYKEWMILVKDQAEKTFELDILETLIEFYEITGWKNISTKLAYEVYACRGFKRESCPCTFMNLDLFHKMMNKKIEQLSLV